LTLATCFGFSQSIIGPLYKSK